MSFSQTQHDEEEEEDDDEEFEDDLADQAADLEEGLFSRIYARQGRRQARQTGRSPRNGASGSNGGTPQPRTPDRQYEPRPRGHPGHHRERETPSDEVVQQRLLNDAARQAKALSAAIESASAALGLLKPVLQGFLTDTERTLRDGVREAKAILVQYPPDKVAAEPRVAIDALAPQTRLMTGIARRAAEAEGLLNDPETLLLVKFANSAENVAILFPEIVAARNTVQAALYEPAGLDRAAFQRGLQEIATCQASHTDAIRLRGELRIASDNAAQALAGADGELVGYLGQGYTASVLARANALRDSAQGCTAADLFSPGFLPAAKAESAAIVTWVAKLNAAPTGERLLKEMLRLAADAGQRNLYGQMQGIVAPLLQAMCTVPWDDGAYATALTAARDADHGKPQNQLDTVPWSGGLRTDASVALRRAAEQAVAQNRTLIANHLTGIWGMGAGAAAPLAAAMLAANANALALLQGSAVTLATWNSLVTSYGPHDLAGVFAAIAHLNNAGQLAALATRLEYRAPRGANLQRHLTSGAVRLVRPSAYELTRDNVILFTDETVAEQEAKLETGAELIAEWTVWMPGGGDDASYLGAVHFHFAGADVQAPCTWVHIKDYTTRNVRARDVGMGSSPVTGGTRNTCLGVIRPANPPVQNVKANRTPMVRT